MGKKIIPIAAAVIGNYIAPGIGGSIGAAVGTKATGGSWGQALGAGAGNYIGGQLGGTGEFGPAGTIGSKVASNFGTTAANFIPGAIASTNFGSAIGSGLGQEIGSSFGAPKQQSSGMGGEAAFKPKQESSLQLPGSLGGLSGTSGEQQSTNIASQGVYGGGTGQAEERYFLNQLNRRLVDPSGKVSGDSNAINPVERSYLSQLGLGGMSDTKSLLEAISKRKYA